MFNFKMLILGLTSVFMLLSGTIQAQQIPLFSGYLVNPYLLSPSFAGDFQHKERGRIMALSRIQFAEIEGAPTTYMLSADALLGSKKMGLGGLVYSDSYGLLNKTGANFTYAYHLSINSTTQVSMGLSAELMQHGIDFERVKAEDKTEDILNLGSANKTRL